MGADLVGFAPAVLPERSWAEGPGAYQEWVDAGMHGSMGYLARDPEKRWDVTRWFEPAKSVVLAAFSYGEAPQPDPEVPDEAGRVARYARSEDYHPKIKEKLRSLREHILTAYPTVRSKIFVDTSPVLERYYGRYAGLGWVGKNTLVISRKIGSFFFLAGVALDQELVYDAPEQDHCGSCDRCLRACPTEAFPRPRVLDASKCIAYFTIEHRGAIPEPFRSRIGNWAFGCDICQEVCPWNRFAFVNPGFAPTVPSKLPLEDMASLTEDGFQENLAHTPMERAGREGLVRNALLAMGNSKNPAFRPTLEKFASDSNPILAEQARWSLHAQGS